MTEFTGERVIPGDVNIDLWNEHLARYSFALRYVSGRRALDVGCGTGYGAASLARHAARVHAIDISGEAVAYAREHYPALNLVFTEASATALPFADAEFDVVTAFEVIEHLENWAALLDEAARVLRPDGLLLISTPNRLYYTESRGKAGPNPYHTHEFDFEEFDAALRQRFPAVSILLQDRTECIAFYPSASSPRPDAALELTADDPSASHFFLALCGREPDRVQPGTFVYVPRAANILRERERHIALLDTELDDTKKTLVETQDAYAAQYRHLEEQNRWALQTSEELNLARTRIADLQDQFAAEQQSAVAMAQRYEAAIRNLEEDGREKVAWARDLETRLTSALSDLSAAVDALHATEATLAERTNWALDLQARLEQAEAQLNLIRGSRWIRLGRSIGVGPELSQ